MTHKAKPTRWHKLDNTANIFPVVANRRFTNVFRLSAVMSEAVHPAVLQQALEHILPYFPAFHAQLRHGLFWSYLETNQATPHVQMEQEAPCRYIDPVQNERYLFRVLYFQNRIHLETFHVLSDGMGALRFLKALCYCYCKYRYPQAFTPQQHATLHGTQHAANIEDGYVKNYQPMPVRTYREPAAFTVRGEMRMLGDMGIVTLLFSVSRCKDVCRAQNVSMGVYLTAAIAYGIYEEYMCSHGSKKPLNVFVTVDLRRFFHCETSLNFFSNILVGLPLDKPGISFEAVLEMVKIQFAEKCTKEQLAQKIAYTVRSAQNLAARMAPLPLKNSILRIIYEQSNKGSTLPFSNLGATQVDEAFSGYFEGFRVMLAPTPREPVKAAAVSFGDTAALTFGTLLEANHLARNVACRLVQAGVPVQVESNESEA